MALAYFNINLSIGDGSILEVGSLKSERGCGTWHTVYDSNYLECRYWLYNYLLKVPAGLKRRGLPGARS